MALHFYESKGQRCGSQKQATQACERNNFTAQRPSTGWSTKANWSENQSKVFCVPEQGLDFSGIGRDISCCCYEPAGGCQVTASIFGLRASQTSSKLVGFLFQLTEKNYLSPELETKKAPASSTQLTQLKPSSPANIHSAPVLEIMHTFLLKRCCLKDQGLMDTFLIPVTVLCATAILQEFSVTA